MKNLTLVSFLALTATSAHALDPLQTPLQSSFSICEISEFGNLRYDLNLKGDAQMGILTGLAFPTYEDRCADEISVFGHYSLQQDNTYFVTLSTLEGDTGFCGPVAYQFIWSANGGTGEAHFVNGQATEAISFSPGACPAE